MENKIADNYLRKIQYFFVPEWIFFCAGVLLVIYSLLNFCSFFTWNNITWHGTVVASLIPLSIFGMQHFISKRIKSRLIYKIQETHDTFILTIYDTSVININKSTLPLTKEPRDYFIRSLFSSRTGTINIPFKDNETCVVKINGKKYYLAPNLFEREVTI